MSQAPATASRIAEIEATISARPMPGRRVSWQDALAAAEGLLDARDEQDATTLDRVNRLLDYAAGLPDADRVGIASTRAMAFISLQLLSDPPKLRALEAVLEAWVLTRDVAHPLFNAFLALGAGNFFTLLKDIELERRHIHAVHDALTFAHDVFDGRADGKADIAVRLLSQVKLGLLQLHEVAPGDAVALHGEARQLAAAALAGEGAQASPRTRGVCHEVAGMIAAANPAGLSPASVVDAIEHLQEAYRCYRQEGEPEETQRCLAKILGLRARSESEPSVAAAWRDAVRQGAGDDRLFFRLDLAAAIAANLAEDRDQDLDEVETLLDLAAQTDVANRGIERAVARVRAIFEALMQQSAGPATAMDYRRAIRLAKDGAARRRYLAEALTTLPDYTEARAGILTAPYATVSAELEAIRRSGLPERDPQKWLAIERQAEQQRLMHEELLARDRQVNSAATGKALLASHLKSGARFLLVLRSFGLETRFVDTPPPFRDEFWEIVRDVEERTSSLVLSGHPLVRELVERLGSDCPTLLAMNVQDPIAPPGAAKLFVSTTNWRRLVFALAAEASAVVAFLGALDPISPGLSDELNALVELGEVGKTVVLIEPGLRAVTEARVDPNAAIVDRMRQDLEAQGFPLVITEEELNADLDEVIALLRRRVTKSRPEPDRPPAPGSSDNGGA